MKKLILLCVCTITGNYVLGQSNTIGSTGNVSIGTTTNNQATLTVKPGALPSAILIGNPDAYSQTVLSVGLSAATNGYSFLQSIKSTSSSTPVWGNILLNPNGGRTSVGPGTSDPLGIFDVKGTTALNGTAASLNGTSLSFLTNTAKMLIGWNKGGSQGEVDFIANKGSGISGVGGFAFFDLSNSGAEERLVWMRGDGLVAIATDAASLSPTTYKLAVGGAIMAYAVKVKAAGTWPDYVFKKGYELQPLTQVKAFIDKNGHLPEMPTAQEIQTNGQDLGEINRLLTQKVEELTLYIIDQDKKQAEYEQQLKAQQERLEKLEKALDKLK